MIMILSERVEIKTMKTADNRLHACKRSANMHCKHDVISKQTSSVKLSDFFSCWTDSVLDLFVEPDPRCGGRRQTEQTNAGGSLYR